MRKVPIWFCCVAFLVFLAAIASWIAVSNETFNGSPGRYGDDVYFENIAYHLANGEGIRFDFSDPQWRQAYHVGNTESQNDWVFELDFKGKTTSRSPGLPIIAAAIYKIVGRNWLAIRIATAFILAIALTFSIATVYRWCGWIAATIAVATMSLDYFLLQTAGQFMTEALGASVICVLFCLCVSLSQTIGNNKLQWQWAGVGVLFGIGILIRANLNAWFLLITGFIALATVWLLFWNKANAKRFLIQCSLFLAGVLLITSPWWIRNCLVTDAFSPFGTSGLFGLAGGYCDQAYGDFGNWNLNEVLKSQQKSLEAPGFHDLELPRQEYLMGRDSSKKAADWIVANPGKLVPLMLMKGISHLGFYRQPIWVMTLNGLLFFGAAIGCFSTIRSRNTIGFWIALVIALSTITTMVTWSHYGRYSIPIRPLIHIASAIGTVVFWKWVLGKRKPTIAVAKAD